MRVRGEKLSHASSRTKMRTVAILSNDKSQNKQAACQSLLSQGQQTVVLKCQ